MNTSQSQPDDPDRHARRRNVQTREVRREAIARARSRERPLREIADDLDVTTDDLRRWLEDARRREATKDVVVKALVSAIAGALLVYRLYRPHAAIDAVTLGLLALAVLPWLSGIVESADFLGSSIKFRELKATQQQQGADIEALNFVIERLVTEPEKLHLNPEHSVRV